VFLNLRIHFFKFHGIGNDYIIINLAENKINNISWEFKSNLAKKLCKRHYSIGADGILFAIPPELDDYHYKMEIFNPDGSEAEMCGNGIRMFAKYLYTKNLVKSLKQKILTKAGLVLPEIIIENNNINGIKVNMGIPKLLRSEIPMIGPEGRVINEDLIINGEKFKITCVNMGNPHCVIFIEDIENLDINIGKKIEYHEVFPNRINVEFVNIINRNEIRVKVWERGVGKTLACGTGACASVVAGVLNSKINRNVLVHLDGGDLKIHWADTDEVFMIGSAEEIFEGYIEVDFESLIE